MTTAFAILQNDAVGVCCVLQRNEAEERPCGGAVDGRHLGIRIGARRREGHNRADAPEQYKHQRDGDEQVSNKGMPEGKVTQGSLCFSGDARHRNQVDGC